MNRTNADRLSPAKIFRVLLASAATFYATLFLAQSSWAASDLSTSVKSVVNISDALNHPGDTLRYTINLIETGASATSGVSVIDFIPAATSNLVIVSIPSGAVDNSTATKVDISNISIAASGTETISFEVDITLGTAVGTKIDNTASNVVPDVSTVRDKVSLIDRFISWSSGIFL